MRCGGKEGLSRWQEGIQVYLEQGAKAGRGRGRYARRRPVYLDSTSARRYWLFDSPTWPAKGVSRQVGRRACSDHQLLRKGQGRFIKHRDSGFVQHCFWGRSWSEQGGEHRRSRRRSSSWS